MPANVRQEFRYKTAEHISRLGVYLYTHRHTHTVDVSLGVYTNKQNIQWEREEGGMENCWPPYFRYIELCAEKGEG